MWLSRIGVLFGMTALAVASTAGAALASGRSAAAFTVERPALPADAVTYRHAQALDSACATDGTCVVVGSYQAGSGGQAYLALRQEGAWTSVRAHVPGNAASDPQATLQSVACWAPGSCAAVGSYVTEDGYTFGLIETLVGGTWHLDGTSFPSALSAVACNPKSCLAIGRYIIGPHSEPLVDELDAGFWHVRNVSAPGDRRATSLDSVACPHKGDCVVDGHDDASPLYFRADRHTWIGNRYPLAAGATLGPIDCPADATCTSLAFTANPVMLSAVRLVDGTPVVEPIPLPGSSADALGLVVGPVDCVTTSVCAGVATAYLMKNSLGVLVTRGDDGWTSVVAPLPGDAARGAEPEIAGISCTATTTCTAVGDYRTHVTAEGRLYKVERPLVEDFDGAGWSASGLSLSSDIEQITSDALLGVSCAGPSCAATGEVRKQKLNTPIGALVAVRD
jgi:hypothetical protein